MEKVFAILVAIGVFSCLFYWGVIAIWFSFLKIKIALFIIKHGYVPAGSGVYGRPYVDTNMPKWTGYIQLPLLICGIILGIALCFSWIMFFTV